MKGYKSFETKRLIITPTTESDANFIYELMNTPKWIKNIGERNIDSIEDAKNYIRQKMIPQLENLGYSNNTIIRKSDNIKIGTCGLYNREGLNGIDIGFAFLPQYEKMGYAYESANKLKELAFTEFGITELSAITIKENIDSQKLLIKLGLTFQEIVELPDDNESLLLYKLKL